MNSHTHTPQQETLTLGGQESTQENGTSRKPVVPTITSTNKKTPTPTITTTTSPPIDLSAAIKKKKKTPPAPKHSKLPSKNKNNK